MTGANNGGAKPNGAWTPEQTVDYMVDKVFSEGDFYVICPDNETSSVSLGRTVFCMDSEAHRAGDGRGSDHVESG
jgi:hypothetical protein